MDTYLALWPISRKRSLCRLEPAWAHASDTKKNLCCRLKSNV